MYKHIHKVQATAQINVAAKQQKTHVNYLLSIKTIPVQMHLFQIINNFSIIVRGNDELAGSCMVKQLYPFYYTKAYSTKGHGY